MTTYRTGNHWGVTIVREQPEPAELVAVVVNGDQALADRICALLNGDKPVREHVEPSLDDWDWASATYAHPCAGCGKRYRTTAAAADCDADHHAYAKRLQVREEA